MNKRKPIYRICQQTKIKYPVESLFKVVRIKTGEIRFDKNQNIKGRSAYLCKDLNIIKEAEHRHTLSKSLRCKVDDSIYIELIKAL